MFAFIVMDEDAQIGGFNLKSINFNTSNAVNMYGMFYGNMFLKSLDLDVFNTLNVTSMEDMFSACRSLIELDLSSFNTSNVIDMNHMLYRCSNIKTSINIMSNNVTNYEYIFYNTSTNEGSSIIVNYIADASTLVDNMILTKTNNSNVVKGNQL